MTLDDLAGINLAELYWDPAEPAPRFSGALLAWTEKDPELRTASMIVYHVYRAAHQIGHLPETVLDYILSPDGKMKVWRDFAQHWDAYRVSDQRRKDMKAITEQGMVSTPAEYLGWMHDGYTTVLEALNRLEQPAYRQQAMALYDTVWGKTIEATVVPLEKRELSAPHY